MFCLSVTESIQIRTAAAITDKNNCHTSVHLQSVYSYVAMQLHEASIYVDMLLAVYTYNVHNTNLIDVGIHALVYYICYIYIQHALTHSGLSERRW